MRVLLSAAVLLAAAHAHGDHGDQGSRNPEPAVPADANWMTKHMAEEHHLDEWDAASFFALHDFNGDGVWQPEEMLATYGLFDESNKGVSEKRRGEIIDELTALLDQDGDGSVKREEFAGVLGEGKTLPDMGTGPGHHGDDEYEYEIHHWEKYHGDDTELEDLTHLEDIEHFKKHAEMDAAEERAEELKKRAVIEENIPAMFRRELR